MKRIKLLNVAVLLVLISAMLVLILVMTETVQAASLVKGRANFYVSSDGNDSWSGTLPAPNTANTDGPFATLTTARDAVRTLKNRGYTSDIRVLIRRGT